MPEAPDLTVVREVLERRLVGLTIDSGRVGRPTALRTLVPDEFGADVAGRSVESVWRYGKTGKARNG